MSKSEKRRFLEMHHSLLSTCAFLFWHPVRPCPELSLDLQHHDLPWFQMACMTTWWNCPRGHRLITKGVPKRVASLVSWQSSIMITWWFQMNRNWVPPSTKSRELFLPMDLSFVGLLNHSHFKLDMVQMLQSQPVLSFLCTSMLKPWTVLFRLANLPFCLD